MDVQLYYVTYNIIICTFGSCFILFGLFRKEWMTLCLMYNCCYNLRALLYPLTYEWHLNLTVIVQLHRQGFKGHKHCSCRGRTWVGVLNLWWLWFHIFSFSSSLFTSCDKHTIMHTQHKMKALFTECTHTHIRIKCTHVNITCFGITVNFTLGSLVTRPSNDLDVFKDWPLSVTVTNGISISIRNRKTKWAHTRWLSWG